MSATFDRLPIKPRVRSDPTVDPSSAISCSPSHGEVRDGVPEPMTDSRSYEQRVEEVGDSSLPAAARFAIAVLDVLVDSQGREWSPKLAYTASKYLKRNLDQQSNVQITAEHERDRALVRAEAAEKLLAETEEFANSSEHPNWEAGWNAGYNRGRNEGKIHAAEAQAAARETLNLLERIRASLVDGTLDIPDVIHAVEAEIEETLAKHASYLEDE